MKRIAVYCSSRFDPNMKYLESFNQLADQFISQGIDVIYGGANVGLYAGVGQEDRGIGQVN